MIGKGVGAALALGCAAAAGARTAPALVPGEVPAPTLTQPLALPNLADRTPVRLMVTREISGNSVKPGDQFKLRVNETVFVAGKPVILVGSSATGEIVAAQRNGRVASAGSITARLVSVDTVGGPIPLTGTQGSQGDSNTGGLALGIAGFGILGLLSRGNEGKLKAGTILTGFIDGTYQLDTATGSLTKVGNPVPTPLIVGSK